MTVETIDVPRIIGSLEAVLRERGGCNCRGHAYWLEMAQSRYDREVRGRERLEGEILPRIHEVHLASVLEASDRALAETGGDLEWLREHQPFHPSHDYGCYWDELLRLHTLVAASTGPGERAS